MEVLRKADKIPGEKYVCWVCKCDCGNETIVRGGCLSNGNTTSCGCFKRENTSETLSSKLTGRRFGKLVVLKRVGTKVGQGGQKNSLWLCRCDCGTIKEIVGASLVQGKVKSCGCVSSYGECSIREILNKLSIKFSTQYTFSDLKSENGGALRFDFAILNSDNSLVALIEYQGVQHFRELERWEDFGRQQREVTDNQKRQYCANNNIRLFEIAYNEDIYKRIDEILSEITIH